MDANLDREFNHFDIIFALRGGKYREDVFANWGEGDWTGNGRFDQFDIIEALRTGNYLQGPYVARSR